MREPKLSLPQSIGLLALRLGVGSMMLLGHGWGKLFNFGDKAAKFPDPIGLGSAASLGMATFAEFFCSILIILGLGTRLAALPLLITMLVAVFSIHSGDPFPIREKALLYGTAYFALLWTGGGQISLDEVIRRWSFKRKHRGRL